MVDRVYRAAPPDALRIEPLGELTAVFDRRSMQTHLVISPLPEILAMMGNEAVSASSLAGRLAADFDLLTGTQQVNALARFGSAYHLDTLD